MRKHCALFDRLLAGVDKSDSLHKDIYHHQVSIFKHIRSFHQRLRSQISLANPECLNICALNPGTEKTERMEKLLSLVLKDSLKEFQEKVHKSILDMQRTLKNRLAREEGLIAQKLKHIPNIKANLKSHEKKQFELTFRLFVTSYGAWILQKKPPKKVINVPLHLE